MVFTPFGSGGSCLGLKLDGIRMALKMGIGIKRLQVRIMLKLGIYILSEHPKE
jgi:hypothetical protein